MKCNKHKYPEAEKGTRPKGAEVEQPWNIESEGFEHKPFYRLYQHKHIKKCRDLIIKDIEESPEVVNAYFINIVKNRFGDLEKDEMQ